MARTKMRLSAIPNNPDGAAIWDYLASRVTGLGLVDPDPANDALYVDADQDVTAILTGATVGTSLAAQNFQSLRSNLRAAITALETANTSLQASGTSAQMNTNTKALAQQLIAFEQALVPVLRYIVSNL